MDVCKQLGGMQLGVKEEGSPGGPTKNKRCSHGSETGSNSEGDLLPVDDMKLKREVRDAIKATGLLISDAFLNNSTEACSGGGNVIVQADDNKERFRALAICALNKVNKNSPELQVLIVSPFRDDAGAIHSAINDLNKRLGINVYVSTAGSDPKLDNKALSGGNVQLLIGTPGRITDLAMRSLLVTKKIRMLVVDNAEKMFGSLSNQKRASSVFAVAPRDIQYMFFVRNLTPDAENFIRDPSADKFRRMFKRQTFEPSEASAVSTTINKKRVAREPEEEMSHAIAKPNRVPNSEKVNRSYRRHTFLYVRDEEERITALIKLFPAIINTKAIVACKNQTISDLVAKKLGEAELPFMHKSKIGQMSHSEYLKEFDNKKTGVIVLTYDVFRHIKSPVVIVNYDMSTSREFLSKRIGLINGIHDEKMMMVSFIDDANIAYMLSKFYRQEGFEKLPEDMSLA